MKLKATLLCEDIPSVNLLHAILSGISPSMVVKPLDMYILRKQSIVPDPFFFLCEVLLKSHVY